MAEQVSPKEQDPPKRKFGLANTMGFLTIGLGIVSIFVFLVLVIINRAQHL